MVSAERDLVSCLNYVVPNANYSFVRFNATKMDKATNFFPLCVLPTTDQLDAILFIEKISLPFLTKPILF